MPNTILCSFVVFALTHTLLRVCMALPLLRCMRFVLCIFVTLLPYCVSRLDYYMIANTD